jgi:ligand-binding SRPBCC domain-containing protein
MLTGMIKLRLTHSGAFLSEHQMPIITLTTEICAPRERVFDLARSIDAHQDTTAGTSERAIAGVTTGLIGLDEEVTWEARHLGLRQRLAIRVTIFDRPSHFQDVMVSGAFKRMVHDHEFAVDAAGTLMVDRFEFESPLGYLGKIVDRLFLTSYLRNFLMRRNQILKRLAESDEWTRYIAPN